MSRHSVLLLSSIGVAAVLIGALLARMLGTSSVALESGTWLPQPRALPEFHLQDLAGAEFNLDSLRGHPTLLFFGFTNCPDVCPTTLATLTQVQRAMPLPGTEVVFVTIDPERDSAANLQVYLGAFSRCPRPGAGTGAAAEESRCNRRAPESARRQLHDGSLGNALPAR
jgi:protein SCO1/2